MAKKRRKKTRTGYVKVCRWVKKKVSVGKRRKKRAAPKKSRKRRK